MIILKHFFQFHTCLVMSMYIFMIVSNLKFETIPDKYHICELYDLEEFAMDRLLLLLLLLYYPNVSAAEYQHIGG